MGIIPIIRKTNLSNAFNNVFIPKVLKFQYGDCSSVVERTVVVRKTGVRFSPLAFQKKEDVK